MTALTLATIQDSIGAAVGVSGTVVVIAAIVIGLYLADQGDVKKKTLAEQQHQAAVSAQQRQATYDEQQRQAALEAQRRQAADTARFAATSGLGVIPSTPVVGVQTAVCQEQGRHDLCTGLAQVNASTVARCTCTCHAQATTSFCGDLGRHDLCPGVVVNGIGSVGCGCTCHASRASRPVQREVVDATATVKKQVTKEVTKQVTTASPSTGAVAMVQWNDMAIGDRIVDSLGVDLVVGIRPNDRITITVTFLTRTPKVVRRSDYVRRLPD